MKKEFYFKIEELPVIAGFVIENVTRDMADFTAFSPIFSVENLKAIADKKDNINTLLHSSVITKQLKVITEGLVAKMNGLRPLLNKTEIYFQLAQGQIDILPKDTGIKQVRQMIGKGNAEGYLKTLRALTAVIIRNQTVLEAKGFTPAMLAEMQTNLNEVEALNTQQSTLTSARNINTQENIIAFNDLWRDIKPLIDTGKAIYQGSNPAKAKDYTVSVLRRRVNVEGSRKKTETPAENPDTTPAQN